MWTAQEPTSTEQLSDSIHRLVLGSQKLMNLSIDYRLGLIQSCVEGIAKVADSWIDVACQAKQIPKGSPAISEEVTTGPVATIRFLQLLAQTLRDIQRTGRPKSPGKVEQVNQQCRVEVFPTPLLYDGILFRPMTATTWLEPEVAPDRLFERSMSRFNGESGQPEVVTVLGAGNVSSIAATDALTKILIENRAVALKLNPVNDYLADIFEVAFESLINADLLSLVCGGIEMGTHLINDDRIGGVHITGSIHSHDAIVWGTDDQSQQRKRDNQPLLKKAITSELGNVSPWAIIPGTYSDRQLRYQAELIATSITNNVSFNCIATKLILTCPNWPQRDRFFELLDEILAKTPRRVAYYPGAAERFEDFSGHRPEDPLRLPWTLIRDLNPETSPKLFCEESFACVCGEVPIEADSPESFLAAATEMMNDQIWGTLAATLTVPDDFAAQHKTALDQSLTKLRFGTIGINMWPALSFALMSPPWGGHPSATLQDAQSGLGFVHNTYMLDQPEKTVLRAPLCMSPKPIWHSNHRHPEWVTRNLLKVYEKPSIMRMLPLSISSFTG